MDAEFDEESVKIAKQLLHQWRVLHDWSEGKTDDPLALHLKQLEQEGNWQEIGNLLNH